MRKLLICCVLSLSAHAQDLDFYAQLAAPMNFGDARFNALAGNTVAMSGSMSALALNPATAGLYRQDAASIDAGFFNSRNRDTSATSIGNGLNFNIGNVGFVARNPDNGWHWFFTFNSDQIFRERIRHEAENGGSILSQLMNNAAGTPPDFLVELGPYEDLMFQSYAVDWNASTRRYTTSADLTNVNTTHSFTRRGLRDRWTLGTGKGLTQRFYIGGSASIIHTFERVDVVHDETFNGSTDLTAFQIEEWWQNSGIGISANGGFYYRPVQALRIAGAIELPHLIAFDQDWETSFRAVRDSIAASGITVTGFGQDYTWTMATAPKLRAGATVVAGRLGLVTASYCYTPTSMGRMLSRNERFINSAIDSTLSDIHQMGIGSEMRFGTLTLRGGWTYITSAQDELDDQIQIGLGASYSSDGFTYYLSYANLIRTKQYFMYSADFTNAIPYSNAFSFVNAGVSVKF